MPAKKYDAMDRYLQAHRRATRALANTGLVPRKSTTKHASKASYDKQLRGVPGGGIVGMIAAPRTGTRTRKESIGVLRSATNANTTQGSYVTTLVVDEAGSTVSNAQGRVEFGR